MSMRWRDLQNFMVSARSRTLTEAALQLGISQPALSESIKRLETDCGAALFYRSRSGIRLTPGGRKFSKKVELLVSDWNALQETFSNEGNKQRSEIIIGSHRSVATYLFPNVLKELDLINQKIDIRLIHDLSRNIQIQVQQGLIDFAVVVNAVPVPDLIIKPVGVDYIKFWKEKSTIADVIIYDPALMQSQNLLRKLKTNPSRSVHTDSFDMTLRCIEEGVGIGLLPERFVKMSSRKLISPSHYPIYKDEISIVYRPEFANNKISQDLVRIIKKQMQK
jgi:DNA-binding transcriptional LysR family regulator